MATDTIRLGKQEYRVVASLTTEQIEEQGLTRHAAELKQNGVGPLGLLMPIREKRLSDPDWTFKYTGDVPA